MDLSTYPILDHHCHSFVEHDGAYTPFDFQRLFSEGGDDTIVAEHTAHSIFYRWAIKELAGFLGCEPTADAVIAARSARPMAELSRAMLADARIETLLIDYGLSGAGRMSVEAMRELLPGVRVEPVLRLEVLAQDLIAQHATFDAFAEAFSARVEAARQHGDIGLKSIIAYRTGLAIPASPSKGNAIEAYNRARTIVAREGQVRLADKPLNDWLVVRALEIAEKSAMPVQFHTGLGDNDLDMWYANPLHLRAALESGKFRNVPFVLLHASYPYVRELGYLASIYHNVWMDVGLAVPFATIDIPAVWRQTLALTPFTKVLFSTDAYSVPDIYWLAARWGRWGLAQVLDESISIGALSAIEAEEAARAILYGNAAKLYAM